jgi:excisionase family DNA binding protein
MDDTEYLRAAEIVALTGLSLRTVRRWIADRIIPSVKLGGARLVQMTTNSLRIKQFIRYRESSIGKLVPSSL